MRYNHAEIVEKSHKRSEKYGIDKNRVASRKILTKKELGLKLEQNKALISIATDFMNVLYDFLSGSGFFIVLTDKEGCILSMMGDEKIVDAARDMDLVVGAYMDEDSIGTNAMGTAIEENAPVQISDAEHFVTAYHRWTCSAAPIHNLRDEIIGTLNLTGDSSLVHPHTLGLVVAAVKSIENQIKSLTAQKKVKETHRYLTSIVDSISIGILAFDRAGRIKSINTKACTSLHLEEREASSLNIASIMPEYENVIQVLEGGEEINDEEFHFNVGAGRKSFSIDAFPIMNKEKLIGTVILIKDMQSVYNLVNKITGMKAMYNFSDIIGESKDMKRIVAEARAVADSPSTILIQGESGTGKEILAQCIHNFSSRRSKSFVAINCGAIPGNLIESELFGYEEGTLTGIRHGASIGKFELANGGTIFLDEIGEMPLELQAVLLRVLQEGTITRVGGTRAIPVNVRVIAATNKNIVREIEKGNFRRDLYYRLAVIPINIPPLRSRKEDIVPLTKHFLDVKATKLGRSVPVLNDEQYAKIMRHKFNGNIRELENLVESIVNLGDVYTVDEIIDRKIAEEEEDVTVVKPIQKPSDDIYICTLDELEARAIKAACAKYMGNISQIAKTLGISRNTLYKKLEKYQIKDFKGDK